MKLLKITFWGIGLIIPQIALSEPIDCFHEGADERLILSCMLFSSSEGIINYENYTILQDQLSRNGYFHGDKNHIASTYTDIQFTPTLSYEENINGGNPDRPLIVGGLTFQGDEEFFSHGGTAIGISSLISLRHIYGEGRYINSRTALSYKHDVNGRDSIVTNEVNLCSNNHLKNWWYFDVCANAEYVDKTFSENTERYLNYSLSKIFHTENVGVTRVALTAQTLYRDDYSQNKLILDSSLINKNNSYFSISGSVAESVEGYMVEKFSVNISGSAPIYDKNITLNFGYKEASGGYLFGEPISERSSYFRVSYPIFHNTQLYAGYQINDNSIDYFDYKYPTLGVQFSILNF